MNERLKYIMGIFVIVLVGAVITIALDALTGTSFSKDTHFLGQGLHDLVRVLTGTALGIWITYPRDERHEHIRLELQ